MTIFAIVFSIGCWWFIMGMAALLDSRKKRNTESPPRPTLTPEEREELEAACGPPFPSWSQITGSWQCFFAAAVTVIVYAVVLFFFWPIVLITSLDSRSKQQ